MVFADGRMMRMLLFLSRQRQPPPRPAARSGDGIVGRCCPHRGGPLLRGGGGARHAPQWRWMLAPPQQQQQQRRSIASLQIRKERIAATSSGASRFDQRPAKEQLVFGRTMTDHMLQIEWNTADQWSAPRIVPYQNLSLSPASSCLHYALQCFEGLKAYKVLPSDSDHHGDEDSDGTADIRLFRPDKNMERLSNSMARLHMPGHDFDRSELVQCIAELVRIDRRWIPAGVGYSLYIRPTVIATTQYLGVAAPDSILLYVICCPVGPYYKSGFQPVRLTTDTPYVRAWPGGTGGNKVGGNYAGTMKAQYAAASEGYGQVLWLLNDEVTEVGAMNVFFVFQHDSGMIELVTPPLDRGDVLPGVTRDSILHLARTKWKDRMAVSERFPTMAEIRDAAAGGRLREAFGAGTAAVVTPIGSIQYKGRDIRIPATGPVTQLVWDELTDIQYGKIEGPAGWSVRIGGGSG